MPPTIYVETSIIGYLTARSGDSPVFAGRQALTREWWANRRHAYRLVSSPLTVEEVGRGDKSAAVERLGYLADVELLDDRDTKIQAIAESLVTRAALPVKAKSDALHVAIAAFHGVDYLMT